MDADGEMQRVCIGRRRLVRPSAREVERISRLENEIFNGLAGSVQFRRPSLVVERQFLNRRIPTPSLRAGDLKHETSWVS